MKTRTGLLIPMMLMLITQAAQARSVGHTAAPARGAGGGGRYERYNPGLYRNYGNGYWYGNGYGYNNYGYGGYSDPNAWGNTNAYGTQTQPQTDPLADFYRQQQINSEMAQQGTSPSTARVSSMVLPNQGMPNQSQLPTDFGGAQGQSVSSEPVVPVEQGNEVRENFHGSGLFKSVWWKNYKNAWFSPAWDNNWVWNNVDWETLVSFWRGSAPKTPADYEFGQNITFRDGKVYYGSQAMMTSEEYYHQAQLLAARGASGSSGKGSSTPHAAPLSKDWAQLGVFSMVPAGEKFSTMFFQLAVDRQGKLRGNCYNSVNDQLDAVEGEIDKSNSRACWTVGKNRSVVYDTGLGNLLSAQSPILVHLDADRLQQRALVRLNQNKL